MISLPLTAFAVDYSYSIEDFFKYYDTTTMPAWREIVDVCKEEYNAPEDAVEKKEYIEKRRFSESVVNGFQKSSIYNSFKTDINKYCYYDEEHEELLPKGYSEDGTHDGDVSEKEYEKNEKEYEKLCRDFDKYISQAEIRNVLDLSAVGNRDNAFTRLLGRFTNMLIGTALSVIQNLDRLAVTAMSLQLTAELAYLAVDLLRPLLGFEGLFKRRKVNTDNDGLATIQGGRTVTVDDHSTQWRLIGRAARLAVEQEYKISDDLGSAVKNDIFKCFLMNKLSQIGLLVLSVMVVYTSLWSNLFIWLTGLFSAL